MPIETAPKDGSLILVFRPKGDGKYIPKISTDYWMTKPNCWGKSNDNTQPIHWMPLPDAPSHNGKKEGE